MVIQPTLRFPIIAIGVVIFLLAVTDPGTAQLTIDADSQYRYAQSRLDAGAVDEAIAEFKPIYPLFPG